MKSTLTLYHRIGRRLLSLRKRAKMTQEALAQEIGASKGAVSLWEQGKFRPSLDFLCAYSEVFEGHVTFHKLCDLAVEPHRAARRAQAPTSPGLDPTPIRGRRFAARFQGEGDAVRGEGDAAQG